MSHCRSHRSGSPRAARWRSVAAGAAAALAAVGCDGEWRDALRGDAKRPASLAEWKAERASLDATTWADEVLAQEYERTLVALWDALLAAQHRGDAAATRRALSQVGFRELRVGTAHPSESLDHGIEVQGFEAPFATLDPESWERWLAELSQDGYELVQSEWHHARFEPPAAGAPARSQVAMILHLADQARGRRIAVDGELGVEWSDRRDARGNPVPAKVDATKLRLSTRSGPPPFERILEYRWPPEGRASRLHPVLVYDLDSDGRSEIVLIGAGRVLWNQGDSRFRDAPLLDHSYDLTETGVIADLDGDGHPDLLSTRARGDLVLYRGDAEGRFRGEPLASPRFEEPLRAPSVLTVGDIDADGDLDVWLAQYKPAYVGGQMPHPFHDANDGYPSHLLRNDGSGGFAPATEEAGLAPKRFRRTYASSFVDLDEDGDQDLLVVSDYSGVDLHHNDGKGHFTDANATLRADRHLFGMSAALADFDLDGRLDLFVAGMASTTARRLEALGLGRSDRPEVQEMRMRMAFGNRMYLASDSGWREPEFRDQVARTGWTWGTTAFDFDNDGDPDLFAANGHASGESSADYCSNFWRHDIYDAKSEPDPELGRLFAEEMRDLAEGRQSWDGHQKNRLLMNRSGKGFVEAAFLLGVADEFDARSALSEDFDRDGRVDLLVVEDHGALGQKLHVYRNRLETAGSWIGVLLREQGPGLSPVGARVVVRTPGRRHVARVVTGETLMGQHSTTLHFGLGDAPRVDSIEVRWPNGASRLLQHPEPGRYHLVLAAEE